MSESIEHEIQKKIIALIKKSPGLYLSKIAELLSMSIPDIQNYLSTLEKDGDITAVKEEGYKKYYIKDKPEQVRDNRNVTIRKEIYNLIEKTPGIFLSKIAEQLGMSIQLADYHLSYMQRNNEIISVKNPGEYLKKYYLVNEQIIDQEYKILELVTKKIPLEIVLYLIKNYSAQHKDIYEHLHISPSRLSYHLTKLTQAGIIEVQSYGNEKGYVLKNRKEIIRFLKKHRFRVELDIAIDEFLDIWNDLNYE
jgi:predicted transcriptional regulator